jgi:hypothetical protein
LCSNRHLVADTAHKELELLEVKNGFLVGGLMPRAYLSIVNLYSVCTIFPLLFVRPVLRWSLDDTNHSCHEGFISYCPDVLKRNSYCLWMVKLSGC